MSYPSKTEFDNLRNSLPLTYQTRGNYAFRTDLARNINTALKNVNTALGFYAKKTDIPIVPANVATKSDLASYALASDLSNYQPAGRYVSPSELENYQPKGDYALARDLVSYAKSSDLTNYQPKGEYASATDLVSYALKSDLVNFQPRGNYQTAGNYALQPTAGNYALQSDLAGYQPRGDYALQSNLAGYQPRGDYALQSDLAGYQVKGNYQTAGNYALQSDLAGYQVKGNYQTAGNYALQPTAGNYALQSDLAGYQPRGNYQTAGNYALQTSLFSYALKSDLANFQPRGNYQTAGNYALQSDLAGYQPRGNYQTAGNYALQSDLAGYVRSAVANEFNGTQTFKAGINLAANSSSDLLGNVRIPNATSISATNLNAGTINSTTMNLGTLNVSNISAASLTATGNASIAGSLSGNSLFLESGNNPAMRLGPSITNLTAGTARLNVQDKSGTYMKFFNGTNESGSITHDGGASLNFNKVNTNNLYVDGGANLRGEVLVQDGIVARQGDTFQHGDNTMPHYGLKWKMDNRHGASAFLSGYGGVKMFTGGGERVNIDINGNTTFTGEINTTKVNTTNLSTGNASISNLTVGNLNLTGVPTYSALAAFDRNARVTTTEGTPFDVRGPGGLRVTGGSLTAGTMDLGTLNVSNISAASLTATGNASISSNLYVGNDLTVNSNLNANNIQTNNWKINSDGSNLVFKNGTNPITQTWLNGGGELEVIQATFDIDGVLHNAGLNTTHAWKGTNSITTGKLIVNDTATITNLTAGNASITNLTLGNLNLSGAPTYNALAAFDRNARVTTTEGIPFDVTGPGGLRVTGNASVASLNVSGNAAVGSLNAGSAAIVNDTEPTLTIKKSDGTSGRIYFGNSGHGIGRGVTMGTLLNENDVNLWTGGEGSIGFVTGETPSERMRINAAGNVGIGTADPSTKLHVNGSATVEGASTFKALATFENNATVTTTEGFPFQVTGPGGLSVTGNLNVNDTATITNLTAGNASITNLTLGNLNMTGVPTFSALATFQRNATVTTTATTPFDVTGPGGLRVTGGGLKVSGNAEIVNDTEPTLTIKKSNGTYGRIYFGNHGHGIGRGDMGVTVGTLSDGNDLNLWTGGYGSIGFVTGETPTERMRINAAGNVGIGKADPSTKLHVGGSATVEGASTFKALATFENNATVTTTANNPFRVTGPGGLKLEGARFKTGDDDWVRMINNDSVYDYGLAAKKLYADNGGLHVNGGGASIKGEVYVPDGIGLVAGDTFQYNNKTLNHYGLKWTHEAGNNDGSTAFLSGYGGIKMFTQGTERVNIESGNTTFTGNIKSSGGTIDDIKTPDGKLKMNQNGIMLGGTNNGRETNSAQISAGLHVPNSLNIVGMSSGEGSSDRKIDAWAEGGFTIRGDLNVTGGNVGIGTTDPSAKLEVNGGNAVIVNDTEPTLTIQKSNGIDGRIYFGNGNHGIGRNVTMGTLIHGNDVNLWTAGGGSIGFATDSTERMRVNADGVTIKGGLIIGNWKIFEDSHGYLRFAKNNHKFEDNKSWMDHSNANKAIIIMSDNGNLWVSRDSIQGGSDTQPVGWVADNLVNKIKSYRLYNRQGHKILQNSYNNVVWADSNADGLWESFRFINSNQNNW